MYNVLVLGSGGREHAIVWSIYQDSRINNIYCAPGNAGISKIAKNVSIDIMNNNKVFSFCQKNEINFVIVGPEQPLENGIVDYFNKNKIKIFGPNKYAAQLETSKLFARNIMEENNIPQPAFFECKNKEDIYDVERKIGLPLVLKADGLAAGKGVIICKNNQEFEDAISDMVINKKFGVAVNKISVEECLYGEELSVFAICDGENYKIITSAQDHKRIFDNDLGPNTGGMGAYSPTPLFDDDLKNKIEERIIKPILKAMNNQNSPYKGFLYIGLMIVENDPYVIEYNVRLGDPEAQVILPLIESSVFDLLLAATDGNIKNTSIKLSDNYAVTVVLASKGYPDKYNKGMLINGLNKIKDGIIFHAGTVIKNQNYYTNGGRVLNVVGTDKSLKEAINNAYNYVHKINYKDKYYRTDIGSKALLKLEKGLQID